MKNYFYHPINMPLYHLSHKTLLKIITSQKIFYISFDAKGERKLRKEPKQHSDEKKSSLFRATRPYKAVLLLAFSLTAW